MSNSENGAILCLSPSLKRMDKLIILITKYFSNSLMTWPIKYKHFLSFGYYLNLT